MAKAHGMKQVGYIDVAGGGQVIVRNGIAFVGHMRAPNGTTIIDVRDPKNPIVLAELQMAPGTHAHKVRLTGDTMVINQEFNFNDPNPPPADWKGGANIYDVSNPRKPHLLSRWETGGQGVHRFDLDERYAYFSSTADGYLAHYADVAAANVNPLEHYEQFGWKEGRDPATYFDTVGYLAANPDVAAANVNPLDHFLQFGIREGRAAVNDGLWH